MIEPDEGPDGDWTRPGTFTVVPGLHRVPLPMPNDGLRSVNVYVLETSDGLVLVDGGWDVAEARDALVAALADLGAGVSDIRRFLVTHIHRDHYTLAVTLRRETGAIVGLGAGEEPSLAVLHAPNRPPLSKQVSLMHQLGAVELAKALAVDHPSRTAEDLLAWAYPDEWLQEGPLQVGDRELLVVATPGHTAGHVVFVDEARGLLLAGDHVLPTITPSIGLEPVAMADPLGDFLRSLALLRARPDTRLLPAHGPVTSSVHARVDELVAHHGRRLDQTEAAVVAGASSGFEVAGRLPWTRRERTLAELDHFNQMLAIGETGAHLELLAIQGRLRREVVDGVRRYIAAGA